MSINTWKNMDAGLLNMVAKVARNEALTVAEEHLIADFLKDRGRLPGEDGFPTAPAGDARGDNALRRTNWFNGRYLTAEALSRQDVYFDTRTRLTAHALMPGVAWGLGLAGDGLNATPIDTEARSGGFPPDRQLTLRRGLAFDHIGRPILVGAPFTFTVEQLLGTYRKTPQRVVGGGVDFMPCVCLAPDPAGPTGGSAALPSGPYLLVIQPQEREEGGAKVMGEICGGAAAANCRADTWRGGFGLSLVRFPVELPLRQDLQSAWDLRGTLSAYFFDVFEHPLWKRWDPDFAVNGPFCDDTGPGRHDAGAIALAMLYLGEDGTVLFLDQWIPRRTICDTPAEDWHRTRFGAPPRAAAWARIHQFQCMLAESLLARPAGADGGNLHSRGFRHIPPMGFLPIRPRAHDGEFHSGLPALDKLLAATKQGSRWLISPLVQDAIEQAERYFNRTRVITYAVVALHDDDLLEDLANVFDKDPIQLTPRVVAELQTDTHDVTGATAGAQLGSHKLNVYTVGTTATTNVPAYTGFLRILSNIFEAMGLDDLVNRRTEIVKLVVPLQGLTRRHPLVGVLAEDALGQSAAWGIDPLLTAGGALGQFGSVNPQAGALAGLVSKIGIDMLPRHFVAYVKQRLVLLDALFYVLEVLQFLITFFNEVRRIAAGMQNRAVTTRELRAQYLTQPAEKRAVAEALLAQPDVQTAFVKAADQSGAGIAVADRNKAFLAQVDRADAALAQTVADPAERRRLAVDQVADAYAAEYPDYQLVQVLAAVQPPQQTLAVVNKLALERGAVAGRTVADELAGDGPAVFENADARPIYADLRASLDQRKVADYVEGAEAGLTVADVLARSPDDAAQLLGADNYARFRKAVQADREAAVAGAEALAKGVPGTLADAVETGIGQGTPASAVIDGLRSETGTASAERPLLDQTANLLRITGGQANFLRFVKRT